MTYRERRLARAERREEWAESRARKAAELHAQNEAHPARHDWAFITQPGRIIERERMNRRDERSWEHAKAAEDHASRAEGIRAQLDQSVYDDDPDAIERLRDKLAELEAKRERIKVRNREARKNGGDTLPAYVLQNLGGNITRTRQRIERLERRQATTGTTAKPARLMSLRYAGTCRDCSAELDKATMAYYDRAARAVICRPCYEGVAS